MQKIKAIIVDDDEFIRETLKEQILASCAWVTICGDFENPLEALSFIHTHKIDLIFLDIQMPMLNGFELLDKLGDDSPHVIFITSYSKYAIKAIRYSAFDYLLKPITADELKAALGRLEQAYSRQGYQEKIATLNHNLQQKDMLAQRLAVPFSNGIKPVRIDDILRLEAQSNYTWIWIRGNQKVLSSKTLKEYEDLLTDYAFVRPNRSQLINRSQIEGWYIKDSMYLLLKDESTVPVSRRRVAEIKELLPFVMA